MKHFYTSKDALMLRQLINNGVLNFIQSGSNEANTYLLLSGGIDSMTCLYALIDQKIKFKTVTFFFDGYASSDLCNVQKLQEKIGFDALYCKVPSDPDIIYDSIVESVRQCLTIYGRVRRVKCETIFALLNVIKYIDDPGSNIISGSCGDNVIGYHKKTAIACAKYGDDSEIVLSLRNASNGVCEFNELFKHDYYYYDPFRDRLIDEYILQFTCKACNASFPKSFFVNAYKDYYELYKSFSKPMGFHKAGNEVVMFDNIAKQYGYKDALGLFNGIAKQF